MDYHLNTSQDYELIEPDTGRIWGTHSWAEAVDRMDMVQRNRYGSPLGADNGWNLEVRLIAEKVER
jgi:hypothetical protein